MAKKGSGKTYTSKGERSSVNPAIATAVRADRSAVDIALNIHRAYNEGRNPWVTIDNPNPKETKARKIRVRANSLWGQPKDNIGYVMPGTGEQKKKKAKG